MTDIYDIYDNRTNRCIASVNYDEAKEYAENPGRYSIVWRVNGMVMAQEDFF